jgi:hypothetical protein
MPGLAPAFGDTAWVRSETGEEKALFFLGGPTTEPDGSRVYWVCDVYEWDIATVRQGRDPEGTAVPVARVRFENDAAT